MKWGKTSGTYSKDLNRVTLSGGGGNEGKGKIGVKRAKEMKNLKVRGKLVKILRRNDDI